MQNAIGSPTMKMRTKMPVQSPEKLNGPRACKADSGTTMRFITKNTAMPKKMPHTIQCSNMKRSLRLAK